VCSGPGDSTVLCGSADGCVWVWDLVSAKVVGKLLHSSRPTVVPTLTIHPSGCQVISASEGAIKLWGEVSSEDILAGTD
jgi:WD40 repeat protein